MEFPQATILEWVAISFFRGTSEELPNPGTEPGYPALQADPLPSEPLFFTREAGNQCMVELFSIKNSEILHQRCEEVFMTEIVVVPLIQIAEY